MPRFSESGADMYICQICGGDFDGEKFPSQWRPDLTGRESAGNVCPTCVEDMVADTVTCRMCKEVTVIWYRQTDHMRWKKGALIQRAMPYLSIDAREMLISQTCGKCWDKLFKEEAV